MGAEPRSGTYDEPGDESIAPPSTPTGQQGAPMERRTARSPSWQPSSLPSVPGSPDRQATSAAWPRARPLSAPITNRWQGTEMRKDPVTEATVRMVKLRDLWSVWLASGTSLDFTLWTATNGNPCIAPVLDPSQSDHCWGRITMEHVKAELRMGVRAKSDSAHLVSLCQGHTEDGRKAGYQWNTSKRNRELVREYLRRFDVEEG